MNLYKHKGNGQLKKKKLGYEYKFKLQYKQNWKREYDKYDKFNICYTHTQDTYVNKVICQKEKIKDMNREILGAGIQMTNQCMNKKFNLCKIQILERDTVF